MTLQQRRLFLQSSLLHLLLLHLFLTHLCKGQSQVVTSGQPIVAAAGRDVLLPCHLEPAVDVTADTLEWRRTDQSLGFVHVWRSGQNLENVKSPSYKGRTSLSVEGLRNGNVSLKLHEVQPSDQGTYECFLPKLQTRASVQLVVASDSVSVPVIKLLGIDRNTHRVILNCECEGRYFEPEVLWLDGEGHVLSAGPTETVRGPDDLYTVSSRVTVEKRHSNSFTCRVQQKDTNLSRDTSISVPDDFFLVQSNSHQYITGSVVCVIVLVLVVSVVFVWKWKQNKTGRSWTEGGKIKCPLISRQRFREEQRRCKEQQRRLEEEQRKREEAELCVQNLTEQLQEIQEVKTYHPRRSSHEQQSSCTVS